MNTRDDLYLVGEANSSVVDVHKPIVRISIWTSRNLVPTSPNLNLTFPNLSESRDPEEGLAIGVFTFMLLLKCKPVDCSYHGVTE